MSENTTYLGQCIINARISVGMTQAELARAMDVDPSSLSKWERGARPIPEGISQDVARALGMTEARFYSMGSNPPSSVVWASSSGGNKKDT